MISFSKIKCFFNSAFVLSVIPLFLVFVLIYLSVSSFKNESITLDERVYLQAGREVWKNPNWHQDLTSAYGLPIAFFDPPLTYYIQGLASVIFKPSSETEGLFDARIMMQPILILFALVVFWVVKIKYGKKAGVLALGLFAFNTEILTHARLIGIDFTLAFTIFLVLISFYYFLIKRSWLSVLTAGFALGLALLTKYNALIILPFLAVSGLCYLVFIDRKININFWVKFLLINLIAIFVLNLGYGFKGSFIVPPTFRSQLFSRVSQYKLGSMILKSFPQPFLVGADFQYQNSQNGWVSFFLGKTGMGGEKAYFLVAFLIKTPIPFLLMILLFLVCAKKRFFEYYLLFSVFYLFVYMSVFNRINIGLRYLLMIFPLLIVLVSGLVKTFKKKKMISFIFLVLTIWYALESLSIYPHYFVYFNQLIGGPRNGYKYLADSNIDWDQDRDYANKYLKDHPEIIVSPGEATIGRVAVSVNFLNLSHDQNFWLRKLNKKPIGYLNYSWLIFDIDKNDLIKSASDL